MRNVIKAAANRIPSIRRLREQRDDFFVQVKRQGEFPAGHYYSPIPSHEDIKEYTKRQKSHSSDLPGIDLKKDCQRALLDEYAEFYPDLKFPEKPLPERRYYYENEFFGYSDAIFLYCFLRKNRPNKIIEVGSGYSSAVMLDTIDELPGFCTRNNIH